MKVAKCFYIAQNLNKSEFEEFEFVTKQRGRKRQIALLSYLRAFRKEQRLPSSPEIQQEFFPAADPQKADTLLRNEYRHMAKELRIFISSRVFERKMRRGEESGEVMYLETLSKKAAPAFLEKEYKLALQRARDTGDPATERALLIFRGKYLSQEGLSKKYNYEETVKIVDQARQANLVDYHYSSRELDNLQAYAELNLWIQDQLFDFTSLPGKGPPAPLEEDDFMAFHREIVAMYQSPGQANAPKILQALAYLENSNSRRLAKPRLKGKLLSNLGLEYMQRGKFEDAIQSFRQALDKPLQLTALERRTISFNLASTLLKAGQYSLSLQQFRELEPQLPDGHPFRQKTLGMTLICLLHLQKYQEARSCIPQDIKTGSSLDHCYLRLTICLIYYCNGEPELALREANNFAQSLRKQKGFALFLRSCLWLQRWIALQSEPDPQKAQQQTDKLKIEMEEAFADSSGPQKSSEPVLWIYDQVCR